MCDGDPLEQSSRWQHCRLCARHSSLGELLDLTADAKTHLEYLEALGFLNADYVDLSEGNQLPKTTCERCYHSVQAANRFFHNVNKAQFALKKIVSSALKPESAGSLDTLITQDNANDPVAVKLEMSNEECKYTGWRADKVVYCRFCAEQKSSAELTDFSEYNTLVRYERYLEYFKADFVDLYLPKLPKTCCGPCDEALRHAYAFFNEVKANQNKLDKLYGTNSQALIIKVEAWEHTEPAAKNQGVHSDPAHVAPAEDDHAASERDQTGKDVMPLSCCAVTIEDAKTDHSWTSYPWLCGVCLVAVASLEQLRAHAKARHGSCVATSCADCRQPFGCYQEFVEHARTHRETLRLHCEYCNGGFESREQCEEHVATHWAGTQKICELCGEMLPYANTLEWHRRLYGRAGSLGEFRRRRDQSWDHYPWACQLCEAVCPTLDALRLHAQNAHARCHSVACADCPKATRDFKAFVDHVRQHRPYLRHYCQYCNASFEETAAVSEHVLRHITSQRRPCHLCGQVFADNRQLAQHKLDFAPPKRKPPRPSGKRRPAAGKADPPAARVARKRTDAQEPSAEELTCRVCDKVFKSLGLLSRHARTHEAARARDHVCPTCGRAFLTRHTLGDHMKTHSSRTEVCQVCHKGFHTRHKLKAHIITHSEARPCVCDTCGARFKTRKRLKSHLKCHSDLKPFKCTYCCKEFKFKENLKTHLYQHTGQRPYCCEFCERTFTNWTNCNKHMVRKHGVTLARTKITSQGRVPIDRRTGEAPRLPCDQSATEWMDAIMRPQKRGKKTPPD